jgi:hypothetical protein
MTADTLNRLKRKIQKAFAEQDWREAAFTAAQALAMLEDQSATAGNDRLRALEAVAQSLIDFETVYQQCTWDSMPGNEHYGGMLQRVVDQARAALVRQGTSAASPQHETDATALDRFVALAQQQHDLDPESAKILRDNLWHLYEGAASPQPQEPK